VRIIGGEARSRQIEAPKGMDTRPTQDKVRESLFNILMWDLEGRIVLDLFAGSGALGLEALSRGAAYAVFVDSSPQAAKIVKSNADRLGFADKAKVIKADWHAAVTTLAPHSKGGFDLVFLDPPYRMANTGEMCSHMLKCHILKQSSLIVIEHALETPPRLGMEFRIADSRRYGDTGITFCTLDAKEGAD
jgi:16S rRNA (guanine(966)-N(2))-methyltransferase RsmD